MFKITVDAERHRVEFQITGSLAEDDAARLTEAIRGAVPQAKAGGTAFNVLADMRETSVMPQTVADRGAAVMAWCAANGMVKAAHVIVSPLARLQGTRINPGPNNQAFATRDEAIAWLES